MKTVSIFLFSAIFFATTVAAPLVVVANNGTTVTGITSLVPCGNGNGTQIGTQYDPNNTSNQSDSGCNFYAFVKMISNITSFLIILSAPIFVGIMVWSGIMFLRYSYTPDKLTTIKKVLKNTFIAFIIILTGWLIVHFIASALLNASFNIFNI